MHKVQRVSIQSLFHLTPALERCIAPEIKQTTAAKYYAPEAEVAAAFRYMRAN
jgi:hypothetical protein